MILNDFQTLPVHHPVFPQRQSPRLSHNVWSSARVKLKRKFLQRLSPVASILQRWRLHVAKQLVQRTDSHFECCHSDGPWHRRRDAHQPVFRVRSQQQGLCKSINVFFLLLHYQAIIPLDNEATCLIMRLISLRQWSSLSVTHSVQLCLWFWNVVRPCPESHTGMQRGRRKTVAAVQSSCHFIRCSGMWKTTRCGKRAKKN